MTGLLPHALLTGGLLGAFACGILPRSGWAGLRAPKLLALLALAAAFAVTAFGRFRHAPTELLRFDGAAIAWQCLFFAAALPLAALWEGEDEAPFALLLGVLLGLSLMAVANHVFLLFMGLELMSLSIYLLLYLSRPGPAALEAAMKYFFSGVAAAGVYLFGFSIYYAATGQMSLGGMGAASPAAAAGTFLMLGAALFKIGAFPLHFWLPDAYEAAKPELSGFMSTAVKAGGFLLLARLLTLVPAGYGGVGLALPWIAALTMTAGNLLALRQENLQRLLAYSSISHAGYMLAAVWAAQRAGSGQGTLFLYLLAYLFTSTGSFLLLKVSGVSTRSELKGLASRSPGLAAFFGLMLLSLAGIPPTAGFLAKLFVFLDVLSARGWWLAAVMGINSAIAMGYYFGLLRDIAFEEAKSGQEVVPPIQTVPAARWTLWICAAGAVLLGLWPGLRDTLSMFLAG